LAVKGILNIKELTYPTSLVISLQAAKDHLRVTTTDEDSVILDCIKAATSMIEQYTGQLLLSRTFCAYLDKGEIASLTPLYIWRYPITSISSVKYINTSGDETTISADDYQTDITDSPARIMLTSIPTAKDDIFNAYRIYFTAGYATVSEIPNELRNWVKVFTAFFFQTRQPEYTGAPVSEIAYKFEKALDKYRKDCIV